MIDHVILNVHNLAAGRAFYVNALAPLGYEVVMEIPGGVGFGIGGKPEFFIAEREPCQTATHIAFSAPDRNAVDAFHAAALEAGGTDNGKPGLRVHYHPSYYGAFVFDPDGNNVEAVCHDPAG
jgi:catechol 2,3-dioxygenase-like lactoylglutathione lyase family enzyme